jgi:hypothetical protein
MGRGEHTTPNRAMTELNSINSLTVVEAITWLDIKMPLKRYRK